MKTRSCCAKDCIRPAKWALFGPDPKAPSGAMLAGVYCGQHKPRIHRDGIGRLVKYDAVAVKDSPKGQSQL